MSEPIFHPSQYHINYSTYCIELQASFESAEDAEWFNGFLIKEVGPIDTSLVLDFRTDPTVTVDIDTLNKLQMRGPNMKLMLYIADIFTSCTKKKSDYFMRHEPETSNASPVRPEPPEPVPGEWMTPIMEDWWRTVPKVRYVDVQVSIDRGIGQDQSVEYVVDRRQQKPTEPLVNGLLKL